MQDDRHQHIAGREEAGGLRATPTPDGVPVKITSPGKSVTMPDRHSMSAGTEKIKSLVRESCLVSPFNAHDNAKSSGSANSSGVTNHGPVGPNPGKDLPRLNCGTGGRSCTARFDRS